MRRCIAIALLAACGSTAPPAATPVAPRPDASVADRRVFRQLHVGTVPIASRTTFELELEIEGARATLVEIDERADRRLEQDAEPEGRWTVRARRTYRGTVAGAGATRELDLAADGEQPLHLHCVARSVDAAPASARRVPSLGVHGPGCDQGMWDPPAAVRVDALVCDAGAADPDGDDDDQLVFAAPVGVEYVTVNNGCALRGGGLRLLPVVTRSVP